MKIEIIEGQDSEDCLWQKMDIDGKNVLNVRSLSECPEDAIIERDLLSCHEVVSLMQMAHAAALRGEKLEVGVTRNIGEA